MPAVSISPQPKLQFFDSAGNPLAGGKLYTYAAGTTTPLASYTDSTGNVANTNPVVLDARGEASVWLAASQYKLALYTATNVLVWTVDNVGGSVSIAQLAANNGSSLVGFIQAGSGAQPRTVQAKLRDVVSVRDFGAVGDGIADDTTAIQAAINSAAQVIDLSGKTYSLSSKLQFTQAGQSMRNGTLLFNGANTTRIADITANNVSFESVVFHGNEKQPRSALVWVAPDVQAPAFRDCTFKKITCRNWGTNVLNQTYAVLISPYGVTNFDFKDCLFQDLIKYNDGINTIPVTPAFIGGGFIGGICFMPEDLSVPTAAQPVVTQGLVEGCTFDNIQTIRAGGLSIADQIDFNDADAIRTYGEPGGAESLFVHVSDCIFKRVSKRCFKFRASGSVAHDNECYATDLPYQMTCPLDLTSNTKVTNLKVYASAALPVYNGINWSVGPDFNRETLVDGMYVSHATNGLVFFTDPTFSVLSNFILRNSFFNQVYDSGIFSTAPIATDYDNIVVDNVQIWGGSSNTIGVQTNGGTVSGSAGFTLKNCYLSNCNINCAGADNSIADTTIDITSSSWVGATTSTYLVRVGAATAANQFIDNLTINASGLNTGFVTASRGVMLLAGSSGALKNISLRVPQALSQSFFHVDVFGNNLLLDGLVYDGPSYVQVGQTVASSDITVMNAVRTRAGGSATAQPFLFTGNAGTTRLTFQNIADFRDPGGTTPSILVNAGTDIAAINVVSNATAAQVVSTGGVVATFGCTKFSTPTQAYALSNVATNRTLDANTISAADLADVVGTLINDLRDRLLVRF